MNNFFRVLKNNGKKRHKMIHNFLHILHLKIWIDNKYQNSLKKKKNLNKLITSIQYESIAENQPMILIPDKDRFTEKSSKLQKKR